jgi:hypothetical protein
MLSMYVISNLIVGKFAVGYMLILEDEANIRLRNHPYNPISVGGSNWDQIS